MPHLLSQLHAGGLACTLCVSPWMERRLWELVPGVTDFPLCLAEVALCPFFIVNSSCKCRHALWPESSYQDTRVALETLAPPQPVLLPVLPPPASAQCSVPWNSCHTHPLHGQPLPRLSSVLSPGLAFPFDSPAGISFLSL
jgi:hypothetical protein